MQLLPDLPDNLASELAHLLARVSVPCRGQVAAMLTGVSCSGSADLQGSLAQWLAGMKPEAMIERYTLVRQLILVAVQIYGEEEKL
jgi:hypothetical protein